jgi:hypothetical protein
MVLRALDSIYPDFWRIFCHVTVLSDAARQKGDDAGKKISGSKRHIAVDT